jgi:hypothetical protein
MNSIKKTSRIAGFLYLLVVPLGIFSLNVSSRLIVPGDAAKTANNIMASESLFRLSIVSGLLASIVMILVVLFLYKLFKPVNSNMASLMVIFLLLAVPIAMLNEINDFAVLQLLNGADYLKVFTTEQLQALALLFLRLANCGGNIAYIFWGLWLIPLGYLVFKSSFLPRILGILLIVAGLGYIIDSLGKLLISNYTITISLYTFIGELLLIFWLLFKGVKDQQPASTEVV